MATKRSPSISGMISPEVVMRRKPSSQERLGACAPSGATVALLLFSPALMTVDNSSFEGFGAVMLHALFLLYGCFFKRIHSKWAHSMRIRYFQIHPTPIADPPLRSSYGLHAPYALRTIVELISDDKIVGI